MATEKTYICLACHETMKTLPEFERYMDAWKHCQEEHDGELFLDTRIRPIK